jgi:RHS repeat-associated protein
MPEPARTGNNSQPRADPLDGNHAGIGYLHDCQGATAADLMSFGYDRLGNVTMRGKDTYKFDGLNRMLEAVGKAKYVYDGHGRRVADIRPDGSQEISIYTFDGKLMYSVAQPAGTKSSVATAHRYLNDSLVKSGLDFVHTDGLRSVVAKTRASAATAMRTRYEPYGLTAAGTVPTVGFGGHVNDGYTGLVYMQQRYYDPLTGRFLSVDPVVTDMNTGDSFNRYAYANNSPYKYFDPDGRFSAQTAPTWDL